MSFYKLKLTANKPHTQDVIGRVLLIDDVIGADSVDVTLVTERGPAATIPDRKAAFKYVAAFTAVIFEASVDCEVWVFLSLNDVSLGITNGALVNVQGEITVTNDAGNPVPVAIQSGGTINVTATNVGVNNNNAGAVPVKSQALSTIVDFAVGSIGTAPAVLVNDSTLRRLFVKNPHATARLALGGPSMTFANAAIILEPGDLWEEDDAAGAIWYAVSDTAATAVRVMGLK